MQQNLDRSKFKVARFENGKFACFLDSEIRLYQDGTLHNAGQFNFELNQDETQTPGDWVYFKPIFSTGLKDKNGNLIFEGDVLQFTETHCCYNKGCKRVVEYDMKYGGFVPFVEANSVGEYEVLESLESNIITVIGNRFENPELLEKI